METLADEVRRLQSGLEEMHGRLAYVLAEISTEMERAQANAEAASLVAKPIAAQPDAELEDLFEASPRAMPAPAAMMAVAATADSDEGLPAAAIVEDFAALPVGEDERPAPIAQDDAEQPARGIEPMPALEAIAPETPAIDVAADATKSEQPVAADATSGAKVVSLDAQRATAAPRRRALTIARWAAVIALIAMGAIVVASTGFADRDATDAETMTGMSTADPAPRAMTDAEGMLRLRAIGAF